MGCPTPACSECARNCLLIHGKNKDSSPVFTSFFKVMIGDNFSEVLFLPPTIARTMPDLVNRETQLEDASGQRWTVTLSMCDGSFAFQQGWHSFSLEHALEVGDFIVFDYILGSHFIVHIYGRNGCERLNFSGENGSRKKRRTNTSSGAQNGKYHSIYNNSMKKQNQGTSALSGSDMEIVTDNALNKDNGSPRNMLNEEQLCMIGMDARHRHEDSANTLYDLPAFETQRTSVVDGTTTVLEHERSPCHCNRMPTSQAGAEIADKIPVTEKVVSSDVPNLEIPRDNEDFPLMEKVVLVSKNDSGKGNTIRQEQRKKTRSRTNQNSQKNDTLSMPGCQSAQQKSDGMSPSLQTENYLSAGEKMKEAKIKQLEMKIEVCGVRDVVNGKSPESKERDHTFKDHVFKVVKPEPVDYEFASADDFTISLTVTETKPFIELPRGLPYASFKGVERRPVVERKAVVFLRDPGSRLWPVIYHETCGLKVLTGGWEAVVEANNVRPGDEFGFEVENKSEYIYKVIIVRKVLNF